MERNKSESTEGGTVEPRRRRYAETWGLVPNKIMKGGGGYGGGGCFIY